ncbi:MAG: HAD family phosphatase [Ruminococcus sp.]|nr:HAD family phosphatase [Ruminococcus sp.]
MKTKGIISDMDGVILDTEKLYVRFWREAASFYGFPMTLEHALGIRSLSGKLAEEKLQGWFGKEFDYNAVRQKRIELMDEFVNQNGVEPKPGAKALLSYIKDNGYALALATATPVDRAGRYLKSVELYSFFDQIVSAREVKRGKPAPDIYLCAAKRLGLDPKECIALEDSQNGIRSAFAAGCKTIMVPDLDQPTEEIMPLLFGVANGLEDVINIGKL